MGKTTREGPNRELEGGDVRSWCRSCDQETIHKIVRSAEYVGEYVEGDFSVTGWTEYQIIECQGCRSISFRQASRDTEGVDFDPRTGESFLLELVETFPKREKRRPRTEGAHFLPEQLHEVYGETLSAMDHELPILAGIGIRAIVETMCKDRGATSGTLEKKIDELVDLQILTPAGADILHSLRIMGNEAAHEVTPHDLDTLGIAIKVVENALQAIYILPEEAARLPKRRKLEN